MCIDEYHDRPMCYVIVRAQNVHELIKESNKLYILLWLEELGRRINFEKKNRPKKTKFYF